MKYVEDANSDEGYEPVPEQWRVRTSQELRELYKSPGLVSGIERTMSEWSGKVRMDQRGMNMKSCLKQIKGGRLENVEND
jgi:hypothetical protein